MSFTRQKAWPSSKSSSEKRCLKGTSRSLHSIFVIQYKQLDMMSTSNGKRSLRAEHVQSREWSRDAQRQHICDILWQIRSEIQSVENVATSFMMLGPITTGHTSWRFTCNYVESTWRLSPHESKACCTIGSKEHTYMTVYQANTFRDEYPESTQSYVISQRKFRTTCNTKRQHISGVYKQFNAWKRECDACSNRVTGWKQRR